MTTPHNGPGPGRTNAALDGAALGATHAFPFERFRSLRFGGGLPRCPDCRADRVHRWGWFAGRRRYRCVACRRTFSDFTGTPLAGLKRIDRWQAFGNCMILGLSVRKAGRVLGIDATTAFRWRHRLLRSLDAADTKPLATQVILAETWFPFSQKGRRNGTIRTVAAGMQGSAGHAEAIDRSAGSRLRKGVPIWVFIARDEAGRTATGVVGPGRPRARDLVRGLQSRLHPDIEIVSSSGPYGAPGLLAARLRVRYRRVRPVAPEIGRVRAYILALRRWLKRFRGVATRYLANYLAWHRFLAAVGSRCDDVSRRCLLAAAFP